MNVLEFLELLPADVRAREVAKLPEHLLRGVPARLLGTARAPRQRRAAARSSAPTTSGSDLTEPQTFVVPMPPLVTNAGGQRSRHWRSLEAEKAAYWELLDLIASARLYGVTGLVIPARPTAPIARVTVTSAMVLGGHMDDDNAVARHKWLIDWLVSRCYLASDRRSCVRWAGFPTQRVTRKEPASITLTISPRGTP